MLDNGGASNEPAGMDDNDDIDDDDDGIGPNGGVVTVTTGKTGKPFIEPMEPLARRNRRRVNNGEPTTPTPDDDGDVPIVGDAELVIIGDVGVDADGNELLPSPLELDRPRNARDTSVDDADVPAAKLLPLPARGIPITAIG